jgi:hypothetical protein
MKKWAVALAAILVLLSGCSHKETTKQIVKKPKPSVVKEEPKETKYYFPLTGIASDTKTDGRAIAVMVSNHPKARPETGLNKADIVYEILAEGDITRFLAVFQSEHPEKVGPVRSARPYYIELAKGLGAFFVAHGFSPDAKKMLDSGYIDNINGMFYDGTLFKRASFRKAPHNSYITYENMLKGASLKHYSMANTPPAFQFMTEEESKNISGDPAKSVMISYSGSHMSDSTFVYDEASGKYKRYSSGEQTIDLETKAPILADNIFIVEAVHRIVDSSGRRVIDFKSGGNAYLLQKGKVNKVSWEFRNGRIVPVKDGKEVPFVPGHTWVNVVPTTPGLAKSVSINAK